ncbi:MAG TPA: hypothetical protein VLM20_08200 [Methylophilaceae bacterium]|nr:hypothetical protein [Methylophilaceae bacterium]
MNMTNYFIAQADKREVKRLKQLVRKGEKHLAAIGRAFMPIAIESINRVRSI